MRFAEADGADGYLIQGYEPGAIRIAGQTYREGLIVTPRRLVPGWGPVAAAQLTPADVEALLDFAPQVILLGTGERQVFPAATLLTAAHKRRIGIEVMDTGAACRTYNILVGEGRDVVAGLMMM
ncbi:Mth938-like domain-containing protein [Thioflavicoccus mobilis]|nr:Mth938-like domain-containing protein [Thioflavicoccus mobilis]